MDLQFSWIKLVVLLFDSRHELKLNKFMINLQSCRLKQISNLLLVFSLLRIPAYSFAADSVTPMPQMTVSIQRFWLHNKCKVSIQKGDSVLSFLIDDAGQVINIDSNLKAGFGQNGFVTNLKVAMPSLVAKMLWEFLGNLDSQYKLTANGKQVGPLNVSYLLTHDLDQPMGSAGLKLEYFGHIHLVRNESGYLVPDIEPSDSTGCSLALSGRNTEKNINYLYRQE